MLLSWKEIHITCAGENAFLVSECMETLGAKAVTFRDAGDHPIFEPDPKKMPLWKKTIVVGLFNADEVTDAMLEDLHKYGEMTVHKLENQDWVRLSLSQFKPIQFGEKFWVCPTWVDPPDPSAINVIVDPGLAFGTGKHATTGLCIEWLVKNLKDEKVVIDYGCGSGILGISAYKLGVEKIYAVDNDEQALITTNTNAKLNNVPESALITFLPRAMPIIKTDLLIANILFQPLIVLYQHFIKFMKPQSKILVSGILDTQLDELMKVYQDSFMLKAPIIREGWVCLEGVFKK